MTQIFSFQSHSVRTLTENNETWFVAADVCAALGLKWTGHKLDMIPEHWQKLARYANFSRSLRFISEPAVYKLAFRSNKKEADEFTNWVASEVLPSIRKTGMFGIAAQPEQPALPCACTTSGHSDYTNGQRLFRMLDKLMSDLDAVKDHMRLWAHPGGRAAHLSPEMETIYSNCADASKMILCSLNQAQFALRIAMGIKDRHRFG